MTILECLKNMLEVDIEEEIFDTQLLAYANIGIAYLIRNKIPLHVITSETSFEDFPDLKDNDIYIVLSWLHLYVLQRFDRTLMQGNQGTTTNWLDAEMTDLITQLKAIYDNEIV